MINFIAMVFFLYFCLFLNLELIATTTSSLLVDVEEDLV